MKQKRRVACIQLYHNSWAATAAGGHCLDLVQSLQRMGDPEVPARANSLHSCCFVRHLYLEVRC